MGKVIGGLKSGKTKSVESHCCHTKYGMGDNYGSGVRNPTGKMRDSYSPGVIPVTPKKLKKPPRSLA